MKDWVYDNWEYVGGLSFLPRSNHVYELAPYEEISEEEYNKMYEEMPDIDYSLLSNFELEDHTYGSKELACVSGVCSL